MKTSSIQVMATPLSVLFVIIFSLKDGKSEISQSRINLNWFFPIAKVKKPNIMVMLPFDFKAKKERMRT
jgi:hypothetical protein